MLVAHATERAQHILAAHATERGSAQQMLAAHAIERGSAQQMLVAHAAERAQQMSAAQLGEHLLVAGLDVGSSYCRECYLALA